MINPWRKITTAPDNQRGLTLGPLAGLVGCLRFYLEWHGRVARYCQRRRHDGHGGVGGSRKLALPHTLSGRRGSPTFYRPEADQKGRTVTELVVAVGIIGVMATLTIPLMVKTTNPFIMSRGAKEIQAALIQARTLAITSRQNICFQAVAGGYAFLQGSCAGAAWIGANTTGTGIFRPADNVTTSGGGAVFTPFGTASTTAVITVSVPNGGSTTVTVQPTGRVTIP